MQPLLVIAGVVTALSTFAGAILAGYNLRLTLNRNRVRLQVRLEMLREESNARILAIYGDNEPGRHVV